MSTTPEAQLALQERPSMKHGNEPRQETISCGSARFIVAFHGQKITVDFGDES